jgi:hypothetical protein
MIKIKKTALLDAVNLFIYGVLLITGIAAFAYLVSMLGLITIVV